MPPIWLVATNFLMEIIGIHCEVIVLELGVDYLVKHGELDLQQLKRMGSKAISAGAEGFLRGSISCSVLIMCEKGLLGNALKGADPTLVGSVVAIVLDTIKNSILVQHRGIAVG